MNFISVTCVERKKISNYKIIIKNKFFLQNLFVSFGSLKSTDIFLPSMKFSLNYHQQNFIYVF